MKKFHRPLIFGIALVAHSAQALVANVTPGPWDLYRNSTKLSSHATQDDCVQAAVDLNVVRNYTCRTNTGVSVVAAPAVAVTISANPSSVNSGMASTLTWSSANATTCTASGAWSGTKPLSGQESTGPISSASTYTLTCTASAGSASNTATVALTPPPGTTAGLEWAGNESTNVRRMLYWSSPFAQYPATYVFKIFPKGPKTGPNSKYWTTFFWAAYNGTFGGDAYYGAHPYPNPAPNGTSQPWEISVWFSDQLGPVPQWNRWYTQVFRAWRDPNGWTQHEFIWDYDSWVASSGTQGVMRYTVQDPGWGTATPRKPAIVVGQAPSHDDAWRQSSWGGYVGYEEFKGVIRGLQFYDAKLTDAQLASEIVSPASARAPWYLNLNPTPSDVTDKSGSGHHGAWEGQPALLWSN